MKKAVVIALLLNAALLAGRVLQELPANAQSVVGPCASDRTLYSTDVNADSRVDIRDVVYLAGWLFTGGEAPRRCLAQAGPSLEERVTALEEYVLAGLPDRNGDRIPDCAQSLTPCAEDLDCPEGHVCQDGWYVPESVTPCAGDTDCPPGHICEGGTCVPGERQPCGGDADCPPGQACEDGVCVPQ